MSTNSVRTESVDQGKYKPISRHAESHRQLGVVQGSRTNLFEQALSKQRLSDLQAPQPSHTYSNTVRPFVTPLIKTLGSTDSKFFMRPGGASGPLQHVQEERPSQPRIPLQRRLSPQLPTGPLHPAPLVSPSGSARNLYKPIFPNQSATK